MSNAADNQKVGRLALRVEGEFWKAYYALPDTMAGAVLLGSIHMRFVANEPRKQAFMDLMRSVVGDIIDEQFGTRPDWGKPKEAPFWEQSG